MPEDETRLPLPVLEAPEDTARIALMTARVELMRAKTRLLTAQAIELEGDILYSGKPAAIQMLRATQVGDAAAAE